MRTVLGNCGGQRPDDTSINVEEIVSGHSGLTWHTGGDNHDVASLQGLAELFLASVAFNLKSHSKKPPNFSQKPSDRSKSDTNSESKEQQYLRSGVDVADVGGDAGGAGDIVEGELGDERVELHEESEGLADATGRAEDGDLALGDGLR